MFNALITSLQIFGIAFTFGIAGPCFLSCTPPLIAYVAGSEKRWAAAVNDISVFLLGRLSAYIILGSLAGFSAKILRQFTGSNLTLFFKPLGGVVSILLGISIFIFKTPLSRECGPVHRKVYSLGGLFVLGFVLGIMPCAPLMALLFEITLISRNALEGMAYGLSFGLGTVLSGLIIAGALIGILSWLPAHMLKSRISNIVFRTICALFLVLFGLGVILF